MLCGRGRQWARGSAMQDTGSCLFETAIGACGIAWREAGLAGVQLPEATPDLTRSALSRRFPDLAPGSPPPDVGAAIAAIRALLAGERRRLDEIVLDPAGIGAFEARVYAQARRVAPGETLTYGALAAMLGDPGLARAVGQALGRNPWPIVIPCHRIVAASGRTGGFSAPGGAATKMELLRIEGAFAPETLALFVASDRS